MQCGLFCTFLLAIFPSVISSTTCAYCNFHRKTYLILNSTFRNASKLLLSIIWGVHYWIMLYSKIHGYICFMSKFFFTLRWFLPTISPPTLPSQIWEDLEPPWPVAWTWMETLTMVRALYNKKPVLNLSYSVDVFRSIYWLSSDIQ